MATIGTTVRLEDRPGIGTSESVRLGTQLGGSLIALLESLESDQWNAMTRCEPWTIKDMSAHLLGWMEALTSMKELTSQTRRALARAREYGNVTDAQNSIQVEDRSSLPESEVLERLRAKLPAGIAARRRLGRTLRYVPLYVPYLGGLTTGGYIANVIFLRDLLVHRLDMYAALGREPEPTEADVRVIEDTLKDWARRRDAHVVVRPQEWPGRSYLAGEGSTVIGGPVVDLIDALAGRRAPSDLQIEGDRTKVESLIASGVPV